MKPGYSLEIGLRSFFDAGGDADVPLTAKSLLLPDPMHEGLISWRLDLNREAGDDGLFAVTVSIEIRRAREDNLHTELSLEGSLSFERGHDGDPHPDPPAQPFTFDEPRPPLRDSTPDSGETFEIWAAAARQMRSTPVATFLMPPLMKGSYPKAHVVITSTVCGGDINHDKHSYQDDYSPEWPLVARIFPDDMHGGLARSGAISVDAYCPVAEFSSAPGPRNIGICVCLPHACDPWLMFTNHVSVLLDDDHVEVPRTAVIRKSLGTGCNCARIFEQVEIVDPLVDPSYVALTLTNLNFVKSGW